MSAYSLNAKIHPHRKQNGKECGDYKEKWMLNVLSSWKYSQIQKRKFVYF